MEGNRAPKLLLATEREKWYLSLGDKTRIPSSRVWATDATEVEKSLQTQKSEDKKDSKWAFFKTFFFKELKT